MRHLSEGKSQSLESSWYISTFAYTVMEDISMDFIVGLPNTSQKHDSIWVIVDRHTKMAHFIPVHTTYNAKRYAEIYLDRIVCLHGVPKTIISDRGAQLVARFWEQLQEYLGTKLIRSLAYHPQTNVQTKRVNQNSRRHVESLCHSL